MVVENERIAQYNQCYQILRKGEKMIKGKKAGRTLDEIGKRWYDFDFKSERVIYCYLCCCKIKEKHFARDIRKLDEKLRFETYQEWKQYVCNKYYNYRTEELSEFSRYLNQKIRNERPINEGVSILLAALTTLIFTEIFDSFLYTYEKINIKIVWLIGCIVFLPPMAYGIAKILSLMFDNNIEKDFFEDYKEIIDEMIEDSLKNHRD